MLYQKVTDKLESQNYSTNTAYQKQQAVIQQPTVVDKPATRGEQRLSVDVYATYIATDEVIYTSKDFITLCDLSSTKVTKVTYGLSGRTTVFTSLYFVSGSLLIPLLFPESGSAATVIVCVVDMAAEPVLSDLLSFRSSERGGRLRLKSSDALILTP